MRSVVVGPRRLPTRPLAESRCRAVSEGHTMRSVMQRWFSPRALLLHVSSSWSSGAAPSRRSGKPAVRWAATDSAGSTLSNGRSSAGIAIAAWWHLIHESAEAREARRRKREEIEPARRQAEW